MGKENPRVKHTKRRIQAALLHLLGGKGLYQITIRELCAAADINRSTFYNHYGSQIDVLSDMAQDYLQSIARTIDEADINSGQSVLSRVTLVLQYIEENLTLSRMLFNYHVDDSFTLRLFTLPKIGEMLDEALAGLQNPHEKQAVKAFAIHGSYRILQDWLNEEARLPASEQAALILLLAGRVCGRA